MTEATLKLFNAFKARNGVYPTNVIVYRDGVSDGEFKQVEEHELEQIKVAAAGVGDVDTMKISIVICQKVRYAYCTEMGREEHKSAHKQMVLTFFHFSMVVFPLGCLLGFCFLQGHKTRLAYEDPQSRQLINPCPGVCVDGQGGARSIASNSTVEFYLNSHAAIQGTAKCTKYTLIHDEVTAFACPSRVPRCLTPVPHPLCWLHCCRLASR